MDEKQKAELLAAQKNANSFCTTEECFIREMLLKKQLEALENDEKSVEKAEKVLKIDEKDEKRPKMRSSGT